MRVESFGQGCLGYVREGAIWFYEDVKVIPLHNCLPLVNGSSLNFTFRIFSEICQPIPILVNIWHKVTSHKGLCKFGT